MAGGTITATSGNVQVNGDVSGYGTINGAIDNAGIVTASGGVLTLSGAVNGTGSLLITAGSELDVDSAGQQTTIAFDGGNNELLQIGNTVAFGATISAFGTEDKIDLSDIAYQSGDYAQLTDDNELQILTSGGTLIDSLNLDLSDDFSGWTFNVGSAAGDVSITDQPCYCPGTLISTDQGEVPVANLAIGDRVLTHSGEMRPIKWIGRRGYGGRFIRGRKDILPICIKAGALDENTPTRDLWISRHHAMYLDGVLIEAKDLVNGVSVVQSKQAETVEYYHIELESHDVILAEGAWSETFLDDDSRGMFHNAQEYAALYPQESCNYGRYCAPRLDSGFALETIRQGLLKRADRIHRRVA